MSRKLSMRIFLSNVTFKERQKLDIFLNKINKHILLFEIFFFFIKINSFIYTIFEP